MTAKEDWLALCELIGIDKNLVVHMKTVLETMNDKQVVEEFEYLHNFLCNRGYCSYKKFCDSKDIILVESKSNGETTYVEFNNADAEEQDNNIKS